MVLVILLHGHVCNENFDDFEQKNVCGQGVLLRPCVNHQHADLSPGSFGCKSRLGRNARDRSSWVLSC